MRSRYPQLGLMQIAQYPVIAVRSANGKVLQSHRQHAGCHRVLPQWVADRTTSVLRGVIDGPDPSRTGAVASIHRPAAVTAIPLYSVPANGIAC